MFLMIIVLINVVLELVFDCSRNPSRGFRGQSGQGRALIWLWRDAWRDVGFGWRIS